MDEEQRKHLAGNWLDEILGVVIKRESSRPITGHMGAIYFGRTKKVLSRGFYYTMAERIQNNLNPSDNDPFESYMKQVPEMREILKKANSCIPQIAKLESELFDETEEVNRLSKKAGGFWSKKAMVSQKNIAEVAASKFNELNEYLKTSGMAEVMYVVNIRYVFPYYHDYSEYYRGKQQSMRYNIYEFLTNALALGVEFAQKYNIGVEKFSPKPTNSK